MTYTNIIPPDERMTWEEATALAEKETKDAIAFDALAKRIQMTEPKPVDPALEAFIAAGNYLWSSSAEYLTRCRAELAKRGGRIVFDGEEG